MNFLLIGGSGFLGTNFALSLAGEGHDITILDRYMGRRELFECQGIDCIEGDFRDPLLLENIFKEKKIQIVFHLAGSITPKQDFPSIREDLDYNIIYPIQLMDVMKRMGVRKLIFVSSGGTVYGDNKREINKETDATYPINTYGWMKLSFEKYIKMAAYQDKVDYLILRVANPYGRWQNVYGRQGFIAVSIGQILKKQPIHIYGDGSVVRDYIYIDDLCRMVIQIINKSLWNETFNMGSGEGHSLNDILARYKDVIPHEFSVNYEEGRSVDFPKNILDIDKLRIALPHFSFTTLEKGIENTWGFALSDYR